MNSCALLGVGFLPRAHLKCICSCLGLGGGRSGRGARTNAREPQVLFCVPRRPLRGRPPAAAHERAPNSRLLYAGCMRHMMRASRKGAARGRAAVGVLRKRCCPPADSRWPVRSPLPRAAARAPPRDCDCDRNRNRSQFAARRRCAARPPRAVGATARPRATRWTVPRARCARALRLCLRVTWASDRCMS